MPIGTYTNALILVGGVDLSNQASHVTVEDDREVVDITTFGAVNKVKAKGLGDAKITITFKQNFDAAKVHATLSPLISSTSTTAVEVRPVNASRSATNPAFLLAAALLFSYNGFDADVGDTSDVEAVFENASTAGMTYPTA